MEAVWPVLSGVVCSVITVLVTNYLRVRTANAELEEKKATGETRRKASETKEEAAARRQARDEYRDLYVEMRQELTAARKKEQACDRRLARVEAALMAQGIPLPPITAEHEAAHEPEDEPEEGD